MPFCVRRAKVKRRLMTAEANRVLFEQLDRDMEQRVSSLAGLIKSLPEENGRGM